MRSILTSLLPAQADNTIQGTRLPCYVFTLIAIVSTVRSFIHLLAPDGGAGTIAGLDLSVAGATKRVHEGQTITVDGNKGVVYLEPETAAC